MFDVHANEITYKNRVIATLVPLPLGFLREVEDTIICWQAAEDIEALQITAREEEFEAGRVSGYEQGNENAKLELEDKKAEIQSDAWDKGYAQGKLDSDHATDIERVEHLLLALQTMHDKLLPLWHGVEETGKFKRRAAKTSETKWAAQSCCLEARIALNRYRAAPTDGV